MEAGRPMNEVTRKLLLTFGGALVLFGVSFIAHKVIGAGGPDTKISHHASLADARQAGVIERGWVPELLPAGSNDITEIHDLDRNTGTGTFRFPSADLEAFNNQAPVRRHGPEGSRRRHLRGLYPRSQPFRTGPVPRPAEGRRHDRGLGYAAYPLNPGEPSASACSHTS
jgi:hypothetical protein